MAHIVIQIGTTRFYAELLDRHGKPLEAEYLRLPDGGESQRLRLQGKALVPGSEVQVNGAGNSWLPARIGEVGEFTRRLTVQVALPTSKPAVALKRGFPSTLPVRRPRRNRTGP